MAGVALEGYWRGEGSGPLWPSSVERTTVWSLLAGVGTCLKLGTHVDNGQMYCVYRNQVAAAYSYLSEAGGNRSTRSHPFQYHRR